MVGSGAKAQGSTAIKLYTGPRGPRRRSPTATGWPEHGLACDGVAPGDGGAAKPQVLTDCIAAYIFFLLLSVTVFLLAISDFYLYCNRSQLCQACERSQPHRHTTLPVRDRTSRRGATGRAGRWRPDLASRMLCVRQSP